MSKDEALKLALEALYNMVEDGDRTDKQQAMSAITAIQEVLAQPEQEPVEGFMWSYLGVDGKERFEFSSFGKTKTKAQKHFNFQNNAQRLEPVKRHKLYAVSMTFTPE